MINIETITVCALIEDVVFLNAQILSLKHIDTLLKQEYSLPDEISSVLSDLWNSSPNTPSNRNALLLYEIDRLGLRLPLQSKWSTLRSIFVSSDEGWFSPELTCNEESLLFINKERKTISDSLLLDLCKDLQIICKQFVGSKGIITSLFDFLEDRGSFISLDNGNHSLFETAKLRAGGVACLLYKIQEYPKQPVPKELFDDSFVLVCSLDFLGIKEFKFQKSYSFDLSVVRSASFYVDLFRENLLDDFLDSAGLTRCNLIFSGGRHLHLFLPNTAHIRDLLKKYIRETNDWLVEQFGLSLYVSYGTCAINGITDETAFNANCYLQLFTEIANQKAIIESNKYTADNLAKIANKLKRQSDLSHPEWMKWIADTLLDDSIIAVSNCKKEGIPIGPNRYIDKWNGYSNDLIRIYSMKGTCSSKHGEVKQIGIWHQTLSKTKFQMLASSKEKYALFRMDIDNFRSKLINNSGNEWRELPSSKMEYSRQLAYFLRRDIPLLLKDYKRKTDNQIILSVIHEGADDLFLFGELKHIIEFTSQMYLYYKQFTLGTGSFSAGICIYDFEKSLIQNAQIAQQLLNQAKTIKGKNAVIIEDGRNGYSWEEFIKNGEDIQNIII